MLTFIIFLAVLSLLVFVHEAGHFFAARRMGITVEEFGFGFPPRLFGWKRKDTIYSINWIPLGGFVRLKGENIDEARHPDSFISKAVWKRTIVIAAGVVMNFVLAFVLFTIGFMVGMPQALEDLPAGAHSQDARIVFGQVYPDSPAAKAKLEPGDTLISIDGKSFETVDEIRAYTQAHAKQPIQISIQRGGEIIGASATPGELSIKPGTVGIGVGFYIVGTVSYPWYLAPVRAAQATFGLTIAIIEAFGQMFKSLVTQGRLGIDVSGPVGIAVLTGRAAAQGFSHLLQLTAVLSLNLGVINFLPLPALDGGRFMFLMIEKVRGRPVSRRLELIIHQIGFALLLALVIVVTYRDISHFSSRLFGG